MRVQLSRSYSFVLDRFFTDRMRTVSMACLKPTKRFRYRPSNGASYGSLTWCKRQQPDVISHARHDGQHHPFKLKMNASDCLVAPTAIQVKCVYQAIQ